MAGDNLFYYTKPDTSAAVLVFTMKPLEQMKDLFAEFLFKADTIIIKTQLQVLLARDQILASRRFTTYALHADIDSRRGFRKFE